MTNERALATVLIVGFAGCGVDLETPPDSKARDELTVDPSEVVWLDDAVPAGARVSGAWNWVGWPVASGSRSHQGAGNIYDLATQHLFEDAPTPFVVNSGDVLTTYVYVQPGAAPYEIMLQWKVGASDWEHRAFWGADLLPWGSVGTPSRQHMAYALPVAGQWVKLEVPAWKVGLESKAITGMAFTQSGGTVYWDRSGKRSGSANIVAASTYGSMWLPFTVNVQGHGSSSVGSIALASDTGNVTIAGQNFSAVAYRKIPYAAANTDIYLTLATASNRMHVLFLYCHGGALTGLFDEGTDGTQIAYQSASGTCAESSASEWANVWAPAVNMQLPPLLHNVSVSGANINFANATPGWVQLATGKYTLLPFSTVDCSISCGAPGWYELHSLLWDPIQKQVGFAILYLFLDHTQPMRLAYSLMLPSLGDPADSVTLYGTWSGTP